MLNLCEYLSINICARVLFNVLLGVYVKGGVVVFITQPVLHS